MNSPDAFRKKITRLLRRELTDKEFQDIWHVKEVLEIRDDDALWDILIALNYYLFEYREFPTKIAEAAAEVLEGTQSAAATVAEAAIQKAHADLAAAVATAAQGVAKEIAGQRRAQWTTVAMATIVAGVAVFAGGWWYAYGQGEKAAEAAFQAQVPAFAWLASEAGQRAQDLSAEGTIDWLDSHDGRLARRFSTEGGIEWLGSEEGQRARQLSADGTLQWVDSDEGRQARKMEKDGLIRWLTSNEGLRARELSADGATAWLDSRAGRRARELSADGTIAWFDSGEGRRARELSGHGTLEWAESKAGQRARQLTADGTISVLETVVGRRLIAAARHPTAGPYFVRMMDCRPYDKDQRWFLSDNMAWCVADGRSWWPYHPAR